MLLGVLGGGLTTGMTGPPPSLEGSSAAPAFSQNAFALHAAVSQSATSGPPLHCKPLPGLASTVATRVPAMCQAPSVESCRARSGALGGHAPCPIRALTQVPCLEPARDPSRTVVGAMPKRRRPVQSDTESDSDGAKMPSPPRLPFGGSICRRRQLLQAAGIPLSIIAMMGVGTGGLTSQFLVEFFAGVASICFGFNVFKMEATKFDKNYSDCMDMNSSMGLATAVDCLCRVHKQGLVWAAPPCSSWVFLSVGTTGRSKERPLGREENEKVRWNNVLVHKLACLLEIATAFGIFFIIEQPTSSTLWQHPRVKEMFNRVGAHIAIKTTHTFMGMFGGDSQKGMKLYGTAPFLDMWRP